MLDFFKGEVTSKDWMFVGGILGATLIVFAAFYVGVYANQETALATVKGQVKKVRDDLKVAIDTEKNYKELELKSEKMNQLVKQFEERLPSEREIPGLMRRFEEIGDTLGLKLELAALPTITEPTKETVPYKVTARGNFHQIVSFINRLERDNRYLKVSDIDINEEKDGVSEATFTLSTFRFTKPPVAADAQRGATTGGGK
jgi:Tfp pilus assembly protein PilO